MAISLNGTSTSYIDGSSSLATSSATTSVCCWINPYALSNAYNGIITRTAGFYYEMMLKSNGKMAYYGQPGFGIDPGLATLSIGTWYHVGFSFSSGSFVGYVNGVVDATAANAGSLAATGPLGIGYDVGNGTRYFNGSMAHVAIYNAALTAADFALLAQGMSPLAVKPDNLTAYWPLNGAQGTLDLGPNSLTATLYQATADNDPPYIIPYRRRILSSNSQPTLNPNGIFPFGEDEMPALFLTPSGVTAQLSQLLAMGVG